MVSMMKTPPKKSALIPLFLAGVAVLLFGSASVAHILDRQPDASPVPGAGSAFVPAKPDEGVRTPARRRCAECGVIESMREVDAGSSTGKSNAQALRRYELTLRMNDGARQVISHARAGTWKVGERVVAFAPVPAPAE